MLQSYLVTEEQNRELLSKNEVFQWLVTALDHAIRGQRFDGYEFRVVDVMKVEYFQTVLSHALALLLFGLHKKNFAP